MTDWERIVATTEDPESSGNPLVMYQLQKPSFYGRFVKGLGGVAYAVCHPKWRSGETIRPVDAALLYYRKRQVDELYSKYGEAWIFGALADFSLTHPDCEIWFNGDRL